MMEELSADLTSQIESRAAAGLVVKQARRGSFFLEKSDRGRGVPLRLELSSANKERAFLLSEKVDLSGEMIRRRQHASAREQGRIVTFLSAKSMSYPTRA